MAIKGKKPSASVPALPQKLSSLLFKAFSFQQLKDAFEGAFKDEKKLIEAYLESNSDGFDVEVSKGFKCAEGQVIYAERANKAIDKDALIDLVKKGTLTIESVIAMGAFSATNLEKSLSSSDLAKVVTDGEPTRYLTLKANSEFKNKSQESFQDIVTSHGGVDVVEELEEATTPKAAPKKELSSIEKAKAAAAKAKSKAVKSKEAEDELADILGE